MGWFNIAFVLLAVSALILGYFAIDVSSIMLTINIAAVAFVVGSEIIVSLNPDTNYRFADDRKVFFIHLFTVLIAVNLTVLYFVKNFV
jgi:hypothetical protein